MLKKYHEHEKKTKNIRQFKNNMHQQIIIKNVRHQKINTNKNRRIESNYQNMFKSKKQKILIIHNLLFKKIIVNRTKLRRS